MQSAANGRKKLSLIREIGMARKGMDSAKGRNKLVLVKRIAEIRTILLGIQGNNAVELVIDPTDTSASLKAMTEYMRQTVSVMPASLRESELEALNQIRLVLVRFTSNKNHNLDDDYEFNQKWVEIRKTLGDTKQSLVDLMEHYKGLGNAFDSDTDRAKAIAELVKEEMQKPVSDLPEQAEAISQAQAHYDEIIKRMGKLFSIANNRNGDYSEDEANAAFEEYKTLYETGKSEAWNRLINADRQKYLDRENRVKAIKESIRPIGESIINTLLSASKVSQEQADEWAESQVISKAAKNRLKKLGYPIADVRRDMAEFYRLSGGKLRGIDIDSAGGKRANASGIENFESNKINLGSRFDKAVLFHELAHHLEADPAAKNAANGFLAKRRKSDKVYRLSQLTGRKGYDRDEVAYEDEFIDHYIGKVYRDGSTEVWSMGLQYLANPTDAAMFIGRDPEMAAMIAGYLQSDLSPAMKALQSVRDHAKGESAEIRDNEEKAYLQALDRLSSGVEIIDDGWFEALDSGEKLLIINPSTWEYAPIQDKNAKFLGSWGYFRVFEGKVKNNSRRLAKGYAICYTDKWNLNGDNGYSRTIPGFATFHGDMQQLKAALKIAKELYDGDIYQAIWQNFKGKIHKYGIINKANQILGQPS